MKAASCPSLFLGARESETFIRKYYSPHVSLCVLIVGLGHRLTSFVDVHIKLRPLHLFLDWSSLACALRM